MKQLKIISATAFATLLLSGCGGGSSDGAKSVTDQIKERDAILIVHGSKESTCSLFRDKIEQEGVQGVIYESTANTVTCATYGRTTQSIDDPNATCAETTLAELGDPTGNGDISILEDDSLACVLAGNN